MTFSNQTQRMVAEGLLAGLTSKEIANVIKVTPRLVKSHLYRMYRKCGITHLMFHPRVKLALLLHDECPNLCCSCNPGEPSLRKWQTQKQVRGMHGESSLRSNVHLEYGSTS